DLIGVGRGEALTVAVARDEGTLGVGLELREDAERRHGERPDRAVEVGVAREEDVARGRERERVDALALERDLADRPCEARRAALPEGDARRPGDAEDEDEREAAQLSRARAH